MFMHFWRQQDTTCGQQQSMHAAITYQLYGSKEELEKTATFILQTELSV